MKEYHYMKLFEEFKLYETMWQESETTKANNSLENLKAALIDSFSAKGYTDEVAILNKCTLKDTTEIKRRMADGYELPIVMLTTDNTLYLHPALAEPENFDKASLAVRVEFAYKILGINLSNKSDFADVRRGLAAIRARLTKSEIALAKNFVLDGKQYMPIRFYNTRKTRVMPNNETVEEALKEANNTDLTQYRIALADYEDDDGYDQEDIKYLLKPGQTKGDLVKDLSYNAGFIGIYVHDERLATSAEIKQLAHNTIGNIPDDDYSYYGSVDAEDWD